MEYIVGIIVALIGGIFFYKNKADKAGVEKRLAETKGRDRELAERQAEIEQSIKELDDGIREMNRKREEEKQKHKNMTLKERADAARNRYKK